MSKLTSGNSGRSVGGVEGRTQACSQVCRYIISDAKCHIQLTAGGKMCWFFFPLCVFFFFFIFSFKVREEISEKTAGAEPSAAPNPSEYRHYEPTVSTLANTETWE